MKTTNKAAFKKATDQVGELYKFADGYSFNTYDEACQAWRESISFPYDRANHYRSCELARRAFLFATGSEEGAAHLQATYTPHGEGWREYTARRIALYKIGIGR